MTKQIKDRIEKEDYSQVAKLVAAQAGVDKSTVYRLFSGARNMTASVRVVNELCKLYGITPDQVLDPGFVFPALDWEAVG